MRINASSIVSPIKLGEKSQVPNQVQVLRVGKFNHPTYGAFEITTQTLAEMKSNFDLKVRGVDMAFDYFHESDKEAAGWVTSLELRENGLELWATVEWTPKAQQKLAERELRYFSPDFTFSWTDPEKNVAFDNVLFGGGLTNRPFVKEMTAIVADEHKGEKMDLKQAQDKIKELEASNLKLSGDYGDMQKKMAAMPGTDKVAALEKQIADLQAELAKAKADAAGQMAENQKLAEEKKKTEKESAFNVLLTEGKACAAQKDAYMAGDMEKYIKLAQPTNTKGSGSSETKTEGDDESAKVLKLAEEKRKENKNLSVQESIALARKEIKK